MTLLSCSYRPGIFPQVFGQAKEWLILELHEMIRVSHLVVFPMAFNLFHNLSRQTDLLKLTENAQF